MVKMKRIILWVRKHFKVISVDDHPELDKERSRKNLEDLSKRMKQNGKPD